MIGYRGKRALDLAIAVPALLVLAPVMAVLALLVRVIHGRPICFVQVRPGLQGRPFAMMKFRSMTNATGPDGQLLPAEARTTRFGAFLRFTSLDELPELLNVIAGDMSVVGPRPLLMDYLQYYSAEQHRRHHAKPGITGWAQVNGRNNLTWEEKFALDIWYVDHASLRLDLRIILKTLLRVASMRDVNKEGLGHAGMDYFRGSPDGALRPQPQAQEAE